MIRARALPAVGAGFVALACAAAAVIFDQGPLVAGGAVFALLSAGIVLDAHRPGHRAGRHPAPRIEEATHPVDHERARPGPDLPGDRAEGLTRHFGMTAGTNLVIAAINLSTGLALARILGPDKRGILAAVINWPIILAVFGTVGLTEASAYYTAKRPERAREYYLSAVLICVPVSTLLGVIGWFAMPWLLSAQSDHSVTISRWLLILSPFATIVAVSEGCLRGLKRVGTWNLYRVLWPVAWLLTVITAAIFRTHSPIFLAVGFALTRGVAAVPVLIWFLTKMPGRLRQSSEVRRALVRYGAPGFFTLLPTVLSSRLDQLLLAGLVNSRVLGLYVISVAWASIATLPAMSLASLMLPRLASIESDDLRRAKFVESSRLGMSLAVASAIPVLIATPVVLPLLFGSAFKEAIPTASILVLAAVFTSWNLVMEDAARGLGSPGTVLVAEGVGLVATVVTLVLLLDRLELVGAAIASVTGYGVTSLLLLRYALRESKVAHLHQLLLPRRSDLAALSPSAIRRKLAKSSATPSDPA